MYIITIVFLILHFSGNIANEKTHSNLTDYLTIFSFISVSCCFYKPVKKKNLEKADLKNETVSQQTDKGSLQFNLKHRITCVEGNVKY